MTINQNPAKPFFASKTIWGIVGTVVTAIAVPSWEAWRESYNWEDVVSAALPALITVVPAGYAVYGRAIATTPLLKNSAK